MKIPTTSTDRLQMARNIKSYYDDLKDIQNTIDVILSNEKANRKDIIYSCEDLIEQLGGITGISTSRKAFIKADLICLQMEINMNHKSLEIVYDYITKELDSYDEIFDRNIHDAGMCKICYDNKITKVLNNCRHGFCDNCIKIGNKLLKFVQYVVHHFL